MDRLPRDDPCVKGPRGGWPDFLWCLGKLMGAGGLAILILVGVLFFIATDFRAEVIRSSIALAICMMGGLAGLIVIDLGQRTNWRAFAPLLATVARTFFTLLGLMGLLLTSEGVVTISLLLYVILFYMVIVWVETSLALRYCIGSSASTKEAENARMTGVSRSEPKFIDSEANSQGKV